MVLSPLLTDFAPLACSCWLGGEGLTSFDKTAASLQVRAIRIPNRPLPGNENELLDLTKMWNFELGRIEWELHKKHWFVYIKFAASDRTACHFIVQPDLFADEEAMSPYLPTIVALASRFPVIPPTHPQRHSIIEIVRRVIDGVPELTKVKGSAGYTAPTEVF